MWREGRKCDGQPTADFPRPRATPAKVRLPTEAMRLVDKVRRAGLKPKPELAVQFGAGGASSVEALA